MKSSILRCRNKNGVNDGAYNNNNKKKFLPAVTDRDGLLTSAFLSLKQKYVSLVFVYLLDSDILCFLYFSGKNSR